MTEAIVKEVEIENKFYQNKTKQKNNYQNRLATQTKADPLLMTILALSTSGIIRSISVIPSWPPLPASTLLGCIFPILRKRSHFNISQSEI